MSNDSPFKEQFFLVVTRPILDNMHSTIASECGMMMKNLRRRLMLRNAALIKASISKDMQNTHT